MMFAILGDAANAYNAIPWQDAFPFMLCIIFLYWVKVKIDTRAGLGKKKLRQLKEVIKEAIESKPVTANNIVRISRQAAPVAA